MTACGAAKQTLDGEDREEIIGVEGKEGYYRADHCLAEGEADRSHGFLLLGLVVEAASGQSYYDYVREHIYKVAGMTSSDSLPESAPVKRTVNRLYESRRRGIAAQYGHAATTGDIRRRRILHSERLLAFANALLGHKLLDAHYTEVLTTGKVDTGRGGKYAYGFEDHTDGGVRWFGHGVMRHDLLHRDSHVLFRRVSHNHIH
jgi:CubicO group peptidase (beta-lactamase class C family)